MTLDLDAVVEERGLDVSISLATGETLALVGPNGAGKTTVLDLVAGLLRPERGEIVLDGRVLSRVRPGEQTSWVAPHDRQVALLAQEPLLFPHLSVRDNVGFGPRSRGASRRTSREVAARWLAELRVDDLADRRPTEISGGQAQRVALARALAAEPRLLLLDEPLAALDVAVAPAMRRTLHDVLADRSAVVVTHDVLDALLLADQVVVLEDGAVAEAGAIADVLARPRSGFAARIAGLNLVPGRWLDGGVLTSDGRRVEGLAGDGAPAPGTPVVAVFRPTAVSVYRIAPTGSPRNTLDVTVTDLEPRGDQVRVRAGDLSADVTPRAATELGLAPGDRVVFSVKATEIAVYPC